MLFRETVIPNTWGFAPDQIVRRPKTDDRGIIRQVWMFSLVVDWPWGECYCSPDHLEIVRPKPMKVKEPAHPQKAVA